MIIGSRNSFSVKSVNKEEEMYKQLFLSVVNGSLNTIPNELMEEITSIRDYGLYKCPVSSYNMPNVVSIGYRGCSESGPITGEFKFASVVSLGH